MEMKIEILASNVVHDNPRIWPIGDFDRLIKDAKSQYSQTPLNYSQHYAEFL